MITEQFVVGYEDSKHGAPFHKDYDSWREDQQKLYELGRHFWLTFNGKYDIYTKDEVQLSEIRYRIIRMML